MPTDSLNSDITSPAAGIPLPVADAIGRIVEITTELFPGEVVVGNSADPEFPDDRFVVFTVEASGELDEILDRECEWLRRVAAVTPGTHTFRLSVHPG
jgi:hypothetical protein